MVGPTRVGGSKLTLTIDGVELHLEATKAELDNEAADADVTTFGDAAAGGARQFFINGSAVQSTVASSFWRHVWAHSGEEDVPFTLRPHGNVTPSADEPHFIGTCTMPPKPKIGGEAGVKKSQVYDFRMDVDGEPVLDDGSDATPIITTVSDATPAVGDPIELNGAHFEGTTGVTVDGIAATFTPVTEGILVVVIPTGAAGAADIVVTNADGASDPFAITVS